VFLDNKVKKNDDSDASYSLCLYLSGQNIVFVRYSIIAAEENKPKNVLFLEAHAFYLKIPQSRALGFAWQATNF
jgi:hypothetical protein